MRARGHEGTTVWLADLSLRLAPFYFKECLCRYMTTGNRPSTTAAEKAEQSIYENLCRGLASAIKNIVRATKWSLLQGCWSPRNEHFVCSDASWLGWACMLLAAVLYIPNETEVMGRIHNRGTASFGPHGFCSSIQRRYSSSMY